MTPNPAFESRRAKSGALAQRERCAATMTMNTRLFFPGNLIVAATIFAGCSEEKSKMQTGNTSDYRKVALAFAKALAEREYTKAYEMTANEYRKRTTVKQLRIAFETIVPIDWGPMGPIEVGHTMTTWPGKQLSDIGWAYVSIGGDVYSEAITVVVTSESGEEKIREVEFGRP